MATQQHFDYIIAGGGTAGCVIASRLKQARPEWSVAIVERGPDERSHPLVLNPLGVSQLNDIGLDQIEKTEPQKHLGGRQIDIHSGNVLSGSSAVNYGVWMRGDRKDYDRWADLVGDKQWGYDGLLPYFMRCEKHYDAEGDKTQHGFDGFITTFAGRQYPARQPLLDGLKEIGLRENLDANAGSPLGISPFTENWSPKRQPAGLAYDLTGVTLITSSVVKRILFQQDTGEEPTATGVELADGTILHASKEVILSCGAYRTPQVLMLSGIGPSTHLRECGIEVVVDCADVGQNLFDHLACFLVWKLDSKAAETGLAAGHPTFFSNAQYLEGSAIDYSVIGSLPSADLKAALQSDAKIGESIGDENALLDERAHYWLLTVYMALASSLAEGYDVQMDGNTISIAALNWQPTSRGSITLRSNDPQEWPRHDPAYNTTMHDKYVMRAATRQMLKLVETTSMGPIIAGELPPQGEEPLTSTASDDEIDRRVARGATSLQHGMGTAAMGKVVDTKLRVKGVRSLRICDASIFPDPVSGTTQVTVYAIAEKLADMILRGE